MENHTKDLQRFIDAQKDTYNQALTEIKNGRKQTHWIWYIFPQIKGLGRSYNSEYYGISSLEEAKLYLGHELLGRRLRTITEELLKHRNESIDVICGSKIDAKKLRSSMTLFNIISPNDIFLEVLNVFFDGKNCRITKNKLGI